MQQARHQLLAGPRLPEQQDRRVARRRRADRLHDLDPGGALADRQTRPVRVVRVAGAQVVDLAPQRPRLHGALQRHLQRVGVGRLQDVIARSRLDAGDGRGDRPLPGQDDHRQVAVAGPQAAHQIQPVRSGHLEIGEDDVDGDAGEGGDRLRRRPGEVDVEAARAQHLCERIAHVRLVLHHQDAAARRWPTRRRLPFRQGVRLLPRPPARAAPPPPASLRGAAGR